MTNAPASKPTGLVSRLVMAVLLAVVTLLIVLPVVVLAIGSFLSEPPRALHFDWAGATLQNYVGVVSDPGFFSMIWTTFGVALVGTAGAVIIGTFFAWLGVRTDIPGRKTLNVIAVIPMFVPPLVGAFAWDVLASPRSGILNIILRSAQISFKFDIYTYTGIAFVFAIYYAPYVCLFVSSALRNMDSVLEEASALSGAGRMRTLFKVTLPLIFPALFSAALLVFILLIELFAIPAVLGEPGGLHFMSSRVWELVGFSPSRVNAASALGMFILLITVALVWIQHRVMAKRNYVTVSGKGLRPTPIALGSARWPLAIIGFSYLIFAVLLPYAALIFIALRKNLFFSSLVSMTNPSQFSFDQFAATYTDPLVRLSFTNSLLVSAGVMIVGGTLYFAIAYVVHRTKLRGRNLLKFITTAPIAIPGIILGLGYLWSWISLPAGIFGTLWIMIFAFVGQFAPQGLQAISSALVQIHPELEESSTLSGANLLYTLRRVVVPLAWPGILAALTLLLVLSFRELAIALFLYTTNTVVFSLAMFDDWARGSTGMVAVMALFQSVVVLVFVAIGQKIQRNRGEGVRGL